MFYSACEIYFMTKCHEEKLRRLCENVKCIGNSDKQRRSYRLLLGLVAKVQGK